ncbi:metallophosphoesterase [Candidatus Altiarchaeota archaeon]
MKALLVGDVHGDIPGLERIREQIKPKDYDMVFLVGDFSRKGQPEMMNARDVNAILDVFKDFRVKAIPGNNDHPGMLDILARRDANLHFKGMEYGGRHVIGYGGGIIAPGGGSGMNYYNTEEAALRDLNELFDAAKSKPTILVSHVPPFGTGLDMTPQGSHNGSRAVLQVIKDRQPEIVICGHNHPGVGMEEMGATTVWNIGAAFEAGAFGMEVGKDIKVVPLGLQRLSVDDIERNLPGMQGGRDSGLNLSR